MIIVGAKGFAKEVLEIFHQNGEADYLCFFDDVNKDIPEKLYQKYPILKSEEEVKQFFSNNSSEFTLGIGNPKLRKILYEKFISLEGTFSSAISKYAEIGSFEVEIGDGCNILGGVKISNSVKIGKGCMIYYNSIITHDVEIGDFVEISPNVSILGRAKISNNVHIATGVIVFPDVTIGENSVVAAGSVVIKDVPANVIIAGTPAVIKREI